LCQYDIELVRGRLSTIKESQCPWRGHLFKFLNSFYTNVCMLTLSLHLGSRVVYLRGDSFNPKACCCRESSRQLPKVYHSGPIFMTQNLVVSYEYPCVTRKVLTQQVTGPCSRRTQNPSITQLLIASALTYYAHASLSYDMKVTLFLFSRYPLPLAQAHAPPRRIGVRRGVSKRVDDGCTPPALQAGYP
jgi:hypothetical protein